MFALVRVSKLYFRTSEDVFFSFSFSRRLDLCSHRWIWGGEWRSRLWLDNHGKCRKWRRELRRSDSLLIHWQSQRKTMRIFVHWITNLHFHNLFLSPGQETQNNFLGSSLVLICRDISRCLFHFFFFFLWEIREFNFQQSHNFWSSSRHTTKQQAHTRAFKWGTTGIILFKYLVVKGMLASIPGTAVEIFCHPPTAGNLLVLM